MTDQNNAAPDLGTSSGGRAYIAEYFATQLRRHDFARYINSTLAADFACVLAQHLSKLRAEGVHAGDEREAQHIETLQRMRADYNPSDGPMSELKATALDAAIAALASAPVAKPKRAPLDDWRVQAIAECLETEWDDMTPASAEADARLIVGYLIAYEKESDEIEARHAAEPVDPVVQAVRNLRASAPVAGEAHMPPGYRVKAVDGHGYRITPPTGSDWVAHSDTPAGDLIAALVAAPKASEAVRILFPAHLRKMWSGGEVQAWLDEHQGITPPNAIAKGSMERYRKWQTEQAQARNAALEEAAALFDGGGVPVVGSAQMLIVAGRIRALKTQAEKDGGTGLPPNSWEADWAEFVAWHKRHFGEFLPDEPLANARRIGWHAGAERTAARLKEQ